MKGEILFIIIYLLKIIIIDYIGIIIIIDYINVMTIKYNGVIASN